MRGSSLGDDTIRTETVASIHWGRALQNAVGGRLGKKLRGGKGESEKAAQQATWAGWQRILQGKSKERRGGNKTQVWREEKLNAFGDALREKDEETQKAKVA